MNNRRHGRFYIRRRTLVLHTALVLLACAAVCTRVFIIPVLAG